MIPRVHFKRVHSSYPTYEEWKPSSIVRENQELPFLVLILPMRNGNKHFLRQECLVLFRSYPTYEEWKLHHLLYQTLLELRSYPTYEEWKQ